MPPPTDDHVRFLNDYYSRVVGAYDITRKYYLLGRDALLHDISAHNPRHVIEVGCGTGRNLAILKRALPATRFGAVEPCDSMRRRASKRYPWITMDARIAENADLLGLLPQPPDVIFCSYSLSMIEGKSATMDNCLRSLAPQGRLYVLDFGDLCGFGRLGRRLFTRFLQRFHVFPEQLESVWSRADVLQTGPFSYWKRGRFRPQSPATSS